MSMFVLTLKLKALDPLVISKFSGSETSHATLDYVPGSALLGAVASLAIEAGNDPKDGMFRRSFLLGDVSFGDSNPTQDGESSVPAPRSWATVKGQVGISDTGSSNVLDLAAFRQNNNLVHAKRHKAQASELASRKQLDLTLDTAEAAKLEDIREGHVVGSDIFLRVDREVHTHTAIDAQRRAASEGQLFSYEAIPAGTTFIAQIKSSDKEILAWLNGLLESRTLRFGRSRSTGYGRASIEDVAVPTAPSAEPVFVDGLQILTLHSDLVLPHGCSGIVDTLTAFHGVGVKELAAAWSHTRSVQAFQGQWGLPRNSAPAIVRGSVFMLKLGKEDFDKLAALCATGLGLRTPEGFGRFSLNHPELHAKDNWRDSIHRPMSTRDTKNSVPLMRPESSALVPAFDRWFDRQIDAFAERLLFSKDVEGLLESSDIKKEPSNSQLTTLRMAAAKGGLKAAGKHLEALKQRTSQWRKWDNCHVKSHLHGGKTVGLGNYIAAVVGEEKLADKPGTPMQEWIARQLDVDTEPMKHRLSGSSLREEFITGARLAFLDLLLRAIVARRRTKNDAKTRKKEAAHV
jgi:hypothetical protein